MSPDRVGICGFELYFPKLFVEQSDLEKFDGVAENKYTIGLGQERMGFCADHEDIVSICLTVVSALLKNYKVSTSSVGFLAVGTETLIDKSKSVKSALMDLFNGSHDIEGVDVKNACYGGTQALFHAVDWVTANWEHEKRYAIVVMGDIAVYEPGPARCTGGAGACALLVGPFAYIALEKGLRAAYMTNTWDFYKPTCSPPTEFPVVDGTLSIDTYFSCLEGAYTLYRRKLSRLRDERLDFAGLDLSQFEAVFFHSPFVKLVRKAFAYLAYLDLLEKNTSCLGSTTELEKLTSSMAKEELLASKQFWTAVMEASSSAFESKTGRALDFSREIGNMYTASLYGQLIALIANSSWTYLFGKRILFFSYGSGAASAMFSAHVAATDSSGMYQQYNTMKNSATAAFLRLNERTEVTPEKYTRILKMREKLSEGKAPYTPQALQIVGDEAKLVELFPGTFYLDSIDEKRRRHYTRTECPPEREAVSPI